MTLNTGIIAGISVTAVVAAASVIDRSMRRTKKTSVSHAKPRAATAIVQSPPRSASQETPYVFGNMVLITNM